MGKLRSAVNLLIRYREIVTVSLLRLSLDLHVPRASLDILFSKTFSIHKKHKIHIEGSEIVMNIKTYQKYLSKCSIHFGEHRPGENNRVNKIYSRKYIYTRFH